MKHPGRRSATMALVVTCTAACEARQPAAPPAVVRDSAGVQIIESRSPLWDASSGWQIETEPALQIGVEDGDAEYEFQSIADAERLDDGSIVVADALAAELRVFDAAGRYVRAIGRNGEGPGEFRNLTAVWRHHDSLAAWDAALRRVSVFDREGNLGRIIAFTASPGDGLRPSALATLADGSFLVHASGVITPALGEGIHRAEGQVVRYSANGEPGRVISALPGEEWVGMTPASGGLLLAPRPFRRDGYVAMSGTRIYVGDSDRFDITVFTVDGVLRQRIRIAGAMHPLTQEDASAHIENTLAAQSNEERRQRVRRTLEQMPYPETYPAFAGLLTDDDGHLWVAESARAVTDEIAWNVFDSSGRWLGRVITPPRARVLRASAGRLLVRHVDDDGIQTIRDHRIHKTDETPVP
jgi:hypothetical protein